MSSYRPICDTWFLARAKLKGGVKFYGAYLGGFPERARALLGVNLSDPVLHVCGGMARLYPYAGGFGPNDATLDLDPATRPDFLRDARDGPYPRMLDRSPFNPRNAFRAVLADPPYSAEDAEHYVPGRAAYPSPGRIVANALDMLPPGGRVGIIHYLLPKPPTGSRFVAAIGIMCGFNNRIRVFSVFERGQEAITVSRQESMARARGDGGQEAMDGPGVDGGPRGDGTSAGPGVDGASACGQEAMGQEAMEVGDA